jgi:SagB-type dehydrogenase domain
MNSTQYIKKLFDEKDILPIGAKNIKQSLAALYHENSKYSEYTLYQDVERIMTFTDPFILRRSAMPFKTYIDKKRYYLKSQINLSDSDFLDILKNRRSQRTYSDYKLDENEISAMCYLSYGVTKWVPIIGDERKGYFGYRNFPSGGALYPMELYFVSFNTYLPQGLYHYRPDINCLEQVKVGYYVEMLNKIILAAPNVDLISASGIFITTNIIERIIIKYGERGYRFLMMECGAVNLLISLVATSLGLDVCSIGGYYDDKVNDFLDIDGALETVNNIIIVGKK